MRTSQQDKSVFFKILKKSYPELHSSILLEVKKGYSDERLDKVAKIKRAFDCACIQDRRLFIAVVLKIFHPSLYNCDNRDIPLGRGLNKHISQQLDMSEGNTTLLIKQVRTWLKYEIDDLRKKADKFYEQNLMSEEKD